MKIVLIPGFLAPTFGEKLYWGEALQDDVITVHPSPAASAHDRACEIFYQLKGGRVDYGHEHSECYNHILLS